MVLPLIPIIIGGSALGLSSWGIVDTINDRKREEEETKQAEINERVVNKVIDEDIPISSLRGTVFSSAPSKTTIIVVSVVVVLILAVLFFTLRSKK